MAENGLFPVSLARHGKRYWRRFTSYEFARTASTCPIVSAEAAQVAAAFPLAFRAGPAGFEPVALLSTAIDAPSPFVGKDGSWRAHYVPSALRCVPFQASTQAQLMVDENSGLVTSDPADIGFFTTDGNLHPELCEVRKFLQARQVAVAKTRRLCDLIARMKLFVPLVQYDGVALQAGLWGVEAKQLERLPDPDLLSLAAGGGLRLIHAHQISLSHSGWLSRAQTAISRRGSAPERELDGFVAALARDASQTLMTPEVIHAPA